MSWTIFETPDGRSVDAWLVTDEADTPGGTDARRGQWVMRERVVVDGIPSQTMYTMDQPPGNWIEVAKGPKGTPANPGIELPEDPRAHLWAMNVNQLSNLAAELGVSYDPSWVPFKKKLVYAIDAVQRGPVALLEQKPDPLPISPPDFTPKVTTPAEVRIDPGPYQG